MSDYGLNVINDNSDTQIDSTYKNFALYAWGTNLYIESSGGGGDSYRTLVPFAATTAQPIVMVRPGTNTYVSLMNLKESNGSYSGVWFTAPGPISTYIDVLIFTAHEPITNIDYGMVVYDGAGQPVYGSNDTSFKIYEVQTFNLPTPSTSTGTIVSTNTDPFYIMSPVGYYYVQIGAPVNSSKWFRVGMKKVNSTTVETKWFVYQALGGNTSAEEGYNPSFFNLVIGGT